MSTISKLSDYEIHDIASILDLQKDETPINYNVSYPKTNPLAKKIVTGSLVLLLNAPVAAYPIFDSHDINGINLIKCIDDYISPFEYEIGELSEFYTNAAEMTEPLDVLFFNKVQIFAETQVELDKDFKLALDELTTEIAKDKPLKPRF
jgi:hypothetical protein